MARIHSYVVRYDSGFAPNPFYGYCTLATCKPNIRKGADIGDWVVGSGSNDRNVRRGGHLVYAMRVTETMTFDEYGWIHGLNPRNPIATVVESKAAGTIFTSEPRQRLPGSNEIPFILAPMVRLTLITSLATQASIEFSLAMTSCTSEVRGQSSQKN